MNVGTRSSAIERTSASFPNRKMAVRRPRDGAELASPPQSEIRQIPLRMNKYRIGRYTPEYKWQVIDVLKHMSPERVSVLTAYFEWKYEQNPYLEPLLFLALHGRRVVGMRGFWGTKWEVKGERYVLPCASNLVVAPDHRRRGIVKQLMDVAVADLADRGYPFVINLNATNIMHIASLSMGWRGAGPLEDMSQGTIWGRVPLPSAGEPAHRRIAGAARRSIRDARRRLFGNGSPFHRFDRAVHQWPIDGIVVEQRPRSAEMAALVHRVGHDGRLRHVRDPEYCEWRYRNPLSEYRFLYWERAGTVDGYLVLATKGLQPAPGVELNIADWVGMRFDVRAELLEAVLSWGGFDALSVWAGPFGDQAKSLLARYGFEITETEISITKPQRTVLVCSTRNGDRTAAWTLGSRDLLNITSWDMRMIYSDGF